MRLLNYIALSLFALVGFISCEMREEIKSGKEGVDMGLLKLSVQAKSPAVTKATSVSTDDFPVSIVGKSVDGEEVERNYDAVADLPESILLPVGTYSVVSHTKGVLEKKLEAPYYKGSLQNGRSCWMMAPRLRCQFRKQAQMPLRVLLLFIGILVREERKP